jgi:hypothetical protein
VNYFDVSFQITSSSKAGITQITSMRPFMSMGLQMSFQRTGLHNAMTGQTLDPCSISLPNNNGPNLDTAFAVFFKLL